MDVAQVHLEGRPRTPLSRPTTNPLWTRLNSARNRLRTPLAAPATTTLHSCLKSAISSSAAPSRRRDVFAEVARTHVASAQN